MTGERPEETPAERKVMRAIVARHHRQSLAERRDALAVHKAAAAAPAHKPVGWDARPTRADRIREAAEAADRARRDAALLTAEDRALRADRRARDKRWDHKIQSTPATMEAAAAEQPCVEARTRQGSLARLSRTGAIDDAQLASAIDIVTVAERIGSDVAVRTASLETRIDAGRIGGGDFFEALGAVRREIAFTAWRRALGTAARPVLDMIVGDTGVEAAARAHGIGRRRALALLVDALDRWAIYLRDAIRSMDARDLDAAHARLAG